MRPLLILSLPLAIGCGPDERLQVETEHLSFHGELEGTCAPGLGALYEREVDRLEHELGRGLLEPVDVHVGPGEVEQRCPAGTPEESAYLAGCVVSDTEVATTLPALSVQLVDAIRRQHHVEGVPFIEKALPQMYGLGRPSPGYAVSIANPRDPDYDLASMLSYGWADEALVRGDLAVHFLHWVQQAYGTPAFHAWLWSEDVREGEDVVDAFAEATGQTITVARERWGDESELEAVFGGFCHGLPAPPLPAEGLLVESAACCDDPGIEQIAPPLLNAGQRCFEVPADAEIDVELLAGEGTLVLRPDGCMSSAEVSPLLLLPGEAATVSLTACRWWVSVLGPEHCEDGAEIRYAITPS